MSEISETEIKSMTKEQNYMRGYEDGKSDVLDKIRAEIEDKISAYDDRNISEYKDCLEIIDRYAKDGE